jgi:hypothetical protein
MDAICIETKTLGSLLAFFCSVLLSGCAPAQPSVCRVHHLYSPIQLLWQHLGTFAVENDHPPKNQEAERRAPLHRPRGSFTGFGGLPFLPAYAQLPSLSPLHDVNRRCIEMLVQAARSDRPGALPLAQILRDELCATTPDIRAHAAQHAPLLVDMQFANADWWRTAKDYPTRPAPFPGWRGAFPRAANIELARATLALAWHIVRLEPLTAFLLGITPAVAEIIVSLSVVDIGQVVERRFRHARPRWEDRPAVWRRLLLTAQTTDARRIREFKTYSLKLMTGDLNSPLAKGMS